ncbi:hypothetical protein [Rhizobium rhizogenes]|uniref:hypothetical protein n=1 Tax=Rhizobium rhizogenes TaxID=359 RepID=UPI000A6EA51E|nr:hypothetical protein [Rhizobium rhizogenes]NTI80410.1 hypothetical protein [Rhizobium rhizogenes]NTJ22596.1 hypothetical protein [Rhizobium rhizogenes]QUE81302.1 hypothetical protein EML492_05700 [Rhizobium rhizogenes]
MKNREPVGRDWLEDFRDRFVDEFPNEPENAVARRAVERNVAADRKQVERPGSVA